LRHHHNVINMPYHHTMMNIDLLVQCHEHRLVIRM
jgi:hypothetical protein